MKRSKRTDKKANRGPKPEVLKIEGGWKDAIKKSFAEKKQINGWPK